jgi:uridylate kinase
VKVKNAKFYPEISYIDVLTQGLAVMDTTAISLCMNNGVPIIVFNIKESGNIKRVLLGEKIGSLVH